MRLTDIEIITIVDGLRDRQEYLSRFGAQDYPDGYEGLPVDAIDELCERLNCAQNVLLQEQLLDPRYWECDCESHYIHLKADRLKCSKCGAREGDGRPDARQREIGIPERMARSACRARSHEQISDYFGRTSDVGEMAASLASIVISLFGVSVSARTDRFYRDDAKEWDYGMLDEIRESLPLSAELEDWWKELPRRRLSR